MSEVMKWDALWTAQEVAALTRMHVITFYRMCKAGHGPRATQLGSIKRFTESDVRKWIAARQSREENVA